MAKCSDLVGKRFDMLTVIELMPERQDRYRLWRCRCDCGGEAVVNTKHLCRGTVTNCGCIPKEDARNGSRPEDLSGKRFGMLTAVRRIESKGGRVRWLCLCDCGNTHTAAAHELKAGKVTSCGCRRALGESTMVDLSGRRFGRLLALSPSSKRDRKGYVYWHCRCDCGKELDITEDNLVHGNYRSCGCLKNELQQNIFKQLHFVDGTCVEWLENRKHRSDNTSGFRGVTLTKHGSFTASIGFKGKHYYIGTFKTFDEAVANRLRAEHQIHDAFVEAYHIWEQDCSSTGKRLPFTFEVEKVNGNFLVSTNIDRPEDSADKVALPHSSPEKL